MSNQDLARELLDETLKKYDVSIDLFEKTLQEEKIRVHLQRRRNITDVLRNIIEQSTPKEDTK